MVTKIVFSFYFYEVWYKKMDSQVLFGSLSETLEPGTSANNQSKSYKQLFKTITIDIEAEQQIKNRLYERSASNQSSANTGESVAINTNLQHFKNKHHQRQLSQSKGPNSAKKVQMKKLIDSLTQNTLKLPLNPNKRQAQISRFQQNKQKHIVKEYEAFAEVEYNKQVLIDKQEDFNPEPTLKQIRSIINIFNVQFNAKSPHIVGQLYRRTKKSCLPQQDSSQFELSKRSNSQKQHKSSRQNSVISLQSLEEEDYSNTILKQLRSTLKKSRLINISKERREIIGYHQQGESFMLRQKRRQQNIDRQLHKFLFKDELKEKTKEKNVNHNDLVLLDFLEEKGEKKVSENVKIYVVKPTFSTGQEKNKFIQKRIVAKSFIRRGYGLNSLRRELTQTNCSYQFDESRYKTICYSMVTETFRKLQQFLQGQVPCFSQRIKKIDIRLIAPFLLNCRDNFPQLSSTFLKLMQLAYNVDAASLIINKRQAIKLYQKIHCYFQSRQDLRDKFEYDCKRKQSKMAPFGNHRVAKYDEREQNWPQESQIQLMQYYIQTPNIAGVRDKYRQKYGFGTDHDDCKAIKSSLYKVLRLAIRKLKAISAQHSQLPSFSNFSNSLNNDKIKRLLISSDAVSARVGLCKLALAKNVSLALVVQAIGDIESSLQTMDRKKGQIEERDDFLW